MGILKKRDMKRHTSDPREQNRHSMRQVGRRERTGSSKTGAESNGRSERAFGDDFNLEHSSSYVSTTVVAFSASSTALEPPTSRSLYGQDLRSPSCVYVG
jgi:hypothetical protein